jgi:hypothetical protein
VGRAAEHAVRFAEEGADLIVLDPCDDIEGNGCPLASRAAAR